MGRSSIFSLEQIYRKQVVGTWSKIPEVFRYVNSLASTSPAGTDFGYFMGGAVESYNPSANFSDVDRLDFSNDTADMVSKAFLTIGKGYMRGFSSLTHGYTAGGYAPSISAVVSTIDRIDYADDTAAQTAKGPLETALSGNIVGFHNTDYGYSVGGYNPSISSVVSLNQRLEFANDTTTTAPKGNLGTAKSYGAGSGNQSYGYYSGGGTPSRVSTVERLDYSSDTSTLAPKGPLSRVVNEHDAAGNADYGYHAGGWDPSSPYSNVTDRIDYASDTSTALVKAILAYPGKHGPTTTGNTSYGYWTGGYGNTTNSYRLDYSSDTTQMSIKGKRTRFSQNGAGVSSRANAMPLTSSADIVPATRTESWTVPVGNDAGYFTAGGAPSPYYSVVDRIDFNNDTAVAATKSPTLVATRGAASVNSTTFGYSVAGATEDAPTGYKTSTVSRLSFAGDTSTQVSVANYPVASGGITGATGNTDFGYISGGYTPAYVSSVYRMDYSSDSIAASPKGPLTFTVQRNAAAGNQSFGYFAGGTTPSRVSTVQRIDYGNDTATATVKGPLNLVNEYLGATGNASYGYFGGGYFTSKVDRIDYANDTPQTSPKGPLLYSFYSAATGNSSYGYWTQGHPSKTSIGRLEYASDTTTASPKGNLSLARFDTGALSSRINGFPTTAASTPVDKGAHGYQVAGALGPAYGYWIAGDGGGSRYHRVDFSNDTGTAGVRGNLDRSMSRNVAVSSMNYAYAAGGWSNTNISRIDYADDTATATPKGNLPPINGLSSPAGVDTINYGYICGGLPLTTVNRIDFSNDTAVASAKGPLTATRRYISAAGNSSYGYVAGGSPAPGYMSSVDRIDYGNDTVTAAVKGNLSYVVIGHGMTGNADYGYVNGGFNAAPGSNNWISSTNRIDYANDTATAAPKGPLTQIRKTKSTGSTSYGWSGGGSTSGHAGTSTMDRIDFSNDTATASARGSLSGTRTNHYAAGAQANAKQGAPTFIPRIRWVDSASEGTPITQGPAFGYFGGGSYPSVSNYTSSVDRIDYENDTSTAAPKGNLSRTTQNHGGANSRTGGYYFGRFPSVSTVDRIDYSNDTATATAKGNLTLARGYTASTGNNDFGYTGGGYPQTSTVDRLDYSNDTADTVEKGPLSIARYGLAATGNQSFGYFVGGQSTSTVDRVDYSSDTDTASPKGPLTGGTRYNTATGNANFGYVTDGYPSKTTIIRIDFSNDTETTSVKGPLAAGASYRGATSSSDFGYFSGGQNPSSAVRSEISRIDYSNDTATAVLKGNLSIAKNKHAGTSSRSHGLPSPQPTIAAPVQPPFPFPVQLPLPIVPENLILHLDAGDSNSYSGSGSMWYDLSGQGNNGTINGATYNSGNGGYLSFDGTNDYVTLPEIDISGDEVTFTVWNYGISNQYSFLLFLTGNSANDRVLSVSLPYPYPYNTNQIYFDKGNTSGYDRINFGVTDSEYQGWHHWAFTANASTGSMKIYLDGVLKHSGTGKTRSLSTPVDGVQNIGSKDGNSFHIGYVSQVLLYKRELSASEVLRNYDAVKSRFGY